MNQTTDQTLTGAFSHIGEYFTLSMGLTLIAALVFCMILLMTLFRAERSVATGALTIITLLAIGIAAAATLRSGSNAADGQASVSRATPSAVVTLAALSCLDGIAGETVETLCERALFASADTVAAAVAYTGAQVTRLRSFGTVMAADRVMTPELRALRRAVERDRFGLVGQVLTARDGCTLSACAFFQSLTNTAQISNNMNEKLYEGFVGHYAPAWNAPPPVAQSASSPMAGLATLPMEKPSGKPVSGDFPTAASIPPISIMSPEPAAPGSQSEPRPPSESMGSASGRNAPAPAKKQSAQKSRPQPPVALAPASGGDDN